MKIFYAKIIYLYTPIYSEYMARDRYVRKYCYMNISNTKIFANEINANYGTLKITLMLGQEYLG